ncbi:MAG: hypothetical protein AAGC65_22330 [Mucilaginibacter sp.]|uniref:hypothetical protein n=1 Tax=Mucilaginibacter sp. TaxID=1882438 RepID=UPI0031AF2B10
MKKNYLILICLFILSVLQVKAQGNYQAGFAILNDGTRISGFIFMDANDPWSSQNHIYLKDSAAVAANPNKEIKAKKYNADELQYYKVGDRTFTKIHYVDLQNLQSKSLGSNNHMLEILNLGRINAYRFYPYPQDTFSSIGSDLTVEQQIKRDHDDKISHWKFLVQKDNKGKYDNIFESDLQKYFEDTPEVLKKYNDGEYGNEPVSKKKGLAAKMMSLAKKATYMPMKWQGIVLAINDYNQSNEKAK